MTVETVLLAVLGVVGVWLAVDSGREAHRLRVRTQRSAARAARRRQERAAEREAAVAAGSLEPGSDPNAWRYWPLTLPSAEDGSIGPRF